MNYIWTCLIVLGMFFANTSCSSDNEPEVEPEEEVILTPIPEGAEPGKVYSISHDKKNDSCTFTIYLGDNPGEDVINEYVGGQIDIYGQDANEGMTFSRKFKSFHVGDTFSIPWVLCERTVMFVIFHSAGDSLIQTEQSRSRVH